MRSKIYLNNGSNLNMPTYDYECPKCHKKFEGFQKITEKPLEACPHCGEKPKRIISSGSGIIFKGSGFYATDYKKTSSKDSKAAPKPSCQEGGCQGCSLNK